MFTKTLLQSFLIVILTILILIVYLNFNQKETNIENLNTNTFDKRENNEIIEGIKYYAKDEKNNSEYIIKAKTGIDDPSNENLIKLEHVVAELKIENNDQVKIFSDFAIYNIITNDTQFFQNVILNYEDHKLICQKMDLNFLKKIVTLSEDLLYRNSNIKLIADKIKINFITKKIIAEMLDDKANIKIISINGINQKIQN
jgi:hypothetical protein